MAQVGAHPSGHELESFALGRLGDERFAAVEHHVAACAACEAAVARMGGDAFTALLQSARSLSDTPRPLAHDATATDACAPGGPPEAGGEMGPPAALADHPRYRPVRQLGGGGMGAVWLAEHRVMNRHVAVKVIRPELLARAGAAERFRRETQAAAMLAHPNIVTAFDAEQVGPTHLLAMEYVLGVSLADELRRRGPLPVAEACDAARQAALGLQCAHGHGLVHRDVKPQNLMRTPDGVIKVLDFGLAVVADLDRARGSLTGGNIVMGTPDYIAPEQAEDARTADARSDVYALGCTLYHLLTGRVPFPGDSVLRKLDAHRHEEPEPLRKRRPEVSNALAAVVARMMAKKPADRYQTAAEVATALGDATRGARPAPRRRRWWAPAGLVLGAVLALAAAYYLRTGDGDVLITVDSPDVELVLSQGGKEVIVFDTKTNKRVRVPTGSYDVLVKNRPAGVEVRPDRLVVARGKDVLVRIEKAKPEAGPRPPGGEVLHVVGHMAGPNIGIYPVAYSPDGRLVLTGSYNLSEKRRPCAVQLWDAATGREVRRLQGQETSIVAAAFSGDGKRVIAGGTDPGNLSRVWDVESGKVVWAFTHETLVGDVHRSVVYGVALSPDGRYAFTCGEDYTVRMWDVEHETEVRRFAGLTSVARSLALSRDGRFLVCGGCRDDGAIFIWEVETGREVRRFEGHLWSGEPGETAIAFAPDGSFIVTGGYDHTVRRWDVATGKEVWRSTGHTDDFEGVLGVAVSPDGRRVLSSGGTDRSVRLWDARTGQELHRFTEHTSKVRGVAFSPDGRFAVSGGDDNTARVYRLPGGPAGASP